MTDTTAKVTWTRPESGGPMRLGYEVYLQDGEGSRLAGRTNSTALGLTGLQAGTRYTVTVVASDGRGASSWSTAAAAFVTGTPAASSCAVHLASAGDWGTGYVGSLDITNTSSEPISGWTLAFTLPRAWESFASGWNATWVANGASVSATNPDWNALIAPGATINIGYVADYTGPNVLPRIFSLNGTLCTSK